MLARISATVTSANRSVGMLSLIGIKRPGGYAAPGRAGCGRAACAPRQTLSEPDGRAHGGDPPRLRLVVGEAERPALGEVRRLVAAAGDDRGGIAVLDVAPAGQV